MVSQISQSDLIAYRTNLLQALEDLKYRRTECQDLHKRLEKVLAEKLHAEEHVEDLKTKLKNAEQRQDHLREELKLVSAATSDSKYKEENQQLKEAVETAEKTVSSLKKELSLMSLAKHQLEVSLKQAEQKVIARETSTKAVIERLRGIESAMEKLSKQLTESSEAQTLLERNVEASKTLNRELVRARAHGNCLLNECKKERDQLREKLVQLECKYRLQENAGPTDREQILNSEIETLKQKVSHFENQNAAKTKLIDHLQCKLKEAQTSASKAHKIAEQSTADDKNVIDLERRLEVSENTCTEWSKKCSDISATLETSTKEKNKTISKITATLEEKESKMSGEIDALKTQLEGVKSEESKLKIEVENFKEVKLSLHEFQVRFESVINEKKSLETGMLEKAELNEKLQTQLESTNAKLLELEGKKQPECAEQESQTEIGVKVASVSVPSIGGTSQKAHTQDAASSNEDPHHSTQKEPQNVECITETTAQVSQRSTPNKQSEILSEKRVQTETELGKIIENSQNLQPHETTCQSAAEIEIPSGPMRPSTAREEVGIYSYDSRPAAEEEGVRHNLTGRPPELPLSKATLDSEQDSHKDSTSKSLLVPYIKKSDSQNKSPPSFTEMDFQDDGPQDQPAKSSHVIDEQDSLSHVSPNMTDVVESKMEDDSDSLDVQRNVVKPQKFSPFVKNPNILCASPVLVNNRRLSLLNSESPDSLSELRKNPVKKRKLSSTPPMLDASQCSVMGGNSSFDLTSKQVPLRVPKNFTKQVLSNKPHSREQPIRYRPLDVSSGSSGSISGPSTNPVTSRPYTNFQFFKSYTSLKDRLASRFGSIENPKSGENRMKSGIASLGFRATEKTIPGSDEEEVAIEISESDDSM